MQKMPSNMEVAPQCTQKLKVGRNMVWIWKLSSFLVFGNFSKIFKKLWILENSREISLLDLDLEAFSFHFSLLEKSESDFYFTFHFSKRVKQIFISLFTSRTFKIHSRRTLPHKRSWYHPQLSNSKSVFCLSSWQFKVSLFFVYLCDNSQWDPFYPQALGKVSKCRYLLRLQKPQETTSIHSKHEVPKIVKTYLLLAHLNLLINTKIYLS